MKLSYGTCGYNKNDEFVSVSCDGPEITPQEFFEEIKKQFDEFEAEKKTECEYIFIPEWFTLKIKRGRIIRKGIIWWLVVCLTIMDIVFLLK